MVRKQLKSAAYFVVSFISAVLHPIVLLRNKCRPGTRVPVLAYHRICPITPGDVSDDWTVTPEAFRAQMEFLSHKGYTVLTPTETIDFLQAKAPFPDHAVVITFDDGYQNNYCYAFSILKKNAIPAAFYLSTAYMDSDRPFPWMGTQGTGADGTLLPLTARQVMEMHHDGMVFGSHSHTHPDLASLRDGQIERELRQSHEWLAAHLPSFETSFVCPFGNITGHLAAVLTERLRSQGYSAAFLGRIGSVSQNADKFDLPRLSIYGRDTLTIFRRKIDGAYDWMECFYLLWKRLASLIDSLSEAAEGHADPY